MDEELTVREHIQELRGVAKKTLIPLIILFALFFWLAQPLTQFLLTYMQLDPTSVVALTPFENLHARATIATSLTLFFGLPILFLAGYSYAKPAIAEKNRKTLLLIVASSTILAVIGAILGVLVFARMILYLLSTTYLLVTPMWSITSVVKQVLALAITTALIMQIVLLIPLLVKYGFVQTPTLKRYRAHVFITLTILAAFISPPDPLSMFVMSIPLYISYEAGLTISKLINR